MNASHPAELRTLAVQARHCDVPTIADALDAAAERIEGLEEKLTRLATPLVLFMYEDKRLAERVWGEGEGCHCSTCDAAREALREVGR